MDPNLLTTATAGWATKVPHTYLTPILHTLTPTLRILLALITAYTIAGITKRRLLTAILTALTCAFCTFGYLMPMFFQNEILRLNHRHHDVELAHVALGVLSIVSAFVGGALGSLLPRPMAGIMLGSGVGLVLAVCVPWSSGSGGSGLFIMVGPILALVGGILTTR